MRGRIVLRVVLTLVLIVSGLLIVANKSDANEVSTSTREQKREHLLNALAVYNIFPTKSITLEDQERFLMRIKTDTYLHKIIMGFSPNKKIDIILSSANHVSFGGYIVINHVDSTENLVEFLCKHFLCP
jgi:uncharacterized membrane protein